MADLRSTLQAEHRHVDALLDQLLNASQSVDPAVLQAAWAELERSLLAHLDFEETQIFPRAALRQPQIIARLREQHEQIRRLLAELGVCCDLHTFRRSAGTALAEILRSHANYEDSVLYPPADELISESQATASEH